MAQEIQQNDQAQPISTWLESLRSSQTPEPEGKREAILVLLAKLALHYWRPDFGPGQARQLYGDYVDDLIEFPLAAIHGAIGRFRRESHQFYPKSGDLRSLIVTPYAWESSRERLSRLQSEAAQEIAQINGIGGSLPPALPQSTARVRANTG